MSHYIAQISVGSVTYSMPFNDHGWDVQGGYFAPIQSWLMPAAYANGVMSALEGLFAEDREATLTFGDPASPTVVERVIVIGTAPADNPQRLQLLLTDVRWYFSRAHICFDANIRRRVGDKRLVGPTLTGAFGADNSTLADSVAYAPWSLNNGSAYNWTSLKEQVLAYLTTARHGRPSIAYVTDSLSLPIGPQIVQETSTDTDGTVGLARAIEAIPGAGIYVDKSGVVHVYDATPGVEAATVKALPPALWRHGDLQLVNNSGIRPTTWRIYVDYAIEVRFDYNPPTTNDSFLNAFLSATALQNVLQVTDQSLTIPAGPWGQQRTVGQGTWITLDEAFAAWGGKTYGPVVLPQLNDDIVADHWFGDALQRFCVGGGITTQDPVWSMRINELMRCYRTFFRVNSSFWDKVRHFWNVRAAVWDPVTGTRAPSPVYSNFHYMSLDNFVSSLISVYGTDVTTSFANSGLLKDGQPSGFRVIIEDEELMVISIDRNELRFPGHTRLAPSPVLNGATVTGGAGLNEAVLQKLQHKTDWHLSTVMTCSPASPNDLRRLYEIQVNIADAAATAGIQIPDSFGPDQEMRSYLAEARVAYQDDSPIPTAIITTFGGPNPDSTINTDGSVTTLTPINLNQELIPLAKAVAAEDLLSKLDHYEGSRAVPMDGNLVPIGSVNKITHRVTKNRAVSVVHCDPKGPHFNAVDFLPASARAFLLQEIQTKR